MAPFFQKRLRCFYCGGNSRQIYKNAVRRWKCESCQAVNYLDENGEITDPPVAEVSTEKRFHRYAAPISPSITSSLSQSFEEQPEQPSAADSIIFCSTCQKNQYLFTQTLASYLPDPSHPEYAAYEKSYPSYKRSLEERYPQVCEKCKPRVIDRIRQAGYAAKTDHLRRMMERSKGKSTRKRRQMWRWKGLLVSTGAFSFWSSVAGQLVWDVVAFASSAYELQEVEVASMSTSSLGSHCVSSSIRNLRIPGECATFLAPYAGLSLILGAFALWWNPKLRLKVEGHHGRLIGLREYYRIQIVALMVRFMAWAGLQDPAITSLHPQLNPSIHAFVAIFTLITTFASTSTIKFEKRPLVDWHDHTEELLSSTNSSAGTQLKSPPEPQASEIGSQSVPKRFPIASLAPRRLATPEPYIPPTPPLDPRQEDVDAMDWTPSRPSLQVPVKPISQQTPALSSSMLFQGQLPQVPKPPAWNLRNPVAGKVEQIQKKPNPFHQAPVLQPTRPSLEEDEIETEEDEEDQKHKPVRTDAVFAAPKFFPPGLTAETGLENLFDQAFSIADGPNAQQNQPGQASINQKSAASGNKPTHVLRITLLLSCLVLWMSTKVYTEPAKSIESVILGISFLVAAFSFLETLMKPMAVWNVTEILLSMFELVSCVYLAVIQARQLDSPVGLDNAGIYLVSFMMGHEMFGLGPLLAPHTSLAEPKNTPKAAEAETKTEKKPSSPTSSAAGSFSTLSMSQNSLSPGSRYASSPQARRPQTANNRMSPNTNSPPSVLPQRHHNSFPDFATRLKATPQPSFTPTTAFAGYTPAPAARRPKPTLSFSPSFDSALQDNPFSPTSTASDSASSVASEVQTPVSRLRFSNIGPSNPSPSIIKSLNLNDGPAPRATPNARYSLRQRRN
ncbi:hypothetical protein TESG_01356 [Trichophyton tonsurans CBS 112818]|uniref:Ima1 N-terminal domain-containing protein n=1 Tax=Trichophyton tonsurans (strain CBS 112818) TaxID=647933 RepID=F2RRB4_TRIT1|nr:hypothetical protein TESG_01356 [Trichophyton tonsurans CBS 112818]